MTMERCEVEILDVSRDDECICTVERRRCRLRAGSLAFTILHDLSEG